MYSVPLKLLKNICLIVSGMALCPASELCAEADTAMIMNETFTSIPKAIASDHPGVSTFAGYLGNHLATLPGNVDQDVSLIYRPLIGLDEKPTVALTDAGAQPFCHLHSPWVQVEVVRSASGETKLHARLSFDIPQLFADQAFLAGLQAYAAPRTVGDSDFMTAAQKYADALITGGPGGPDLDALATTLSPGLIWLFQYAPQSTRGPFFSAARTAADRAAQELAQPYAELVFAMIFLCVRSEIPQRYDISGISDPALLSIEVGGRDFRRFLEEYEISIKH